MSVDPNTIQSDWLTGLGHGFLSLFGAGDAFDPLNQLNSDLATAKDQLNTTIQIGVQNSLTAQKDFDNNLITWLNGRLPYIEKSQEFYNQISSDRNIQENYFTIILFILVFIIIFFMIIK